MKPLVISGFPGVGKSTITHRYPWIRDSDSSTFDKAYFPTNYVEHIQSVIKKKETILVSSHKAVREALKEAGIPFNLYYPDIQCKDEYLERYRRRGSPDSFVKLLEGFWAAWIGECEDWDGLKVRMAPRTYLSDYLSL